ncbi:TetR/AcrR family transcriptional regulator [Novosphingobium sp. FKTRR1]|uniref:TetR/AcrR family transcriptional regulator n=1 Tax=Novosphingobium sp. FKTRR1 TaxID=2879118 RepID=UPI001CF05497|nr:TetR/AcrR family transcriptional regulator [Novosphingobium sp. FKTRR1]
MADKSAHKAKVRARILDEAAAALRSGGTEGLSVANLMKRAGLTHGGFYAHFENRDDLVAHAVERMFEDSAGLFTRLLPSGAGPAELGALVDSYLSEAAMRRHDRGCPLPWLAGEVPRMPPAAQARFRQGIDRMRSAIASVLQANGVAEGQAQASAASAVAEMVGAMALARAMGEGEDAVAMLADARRAISQRLGATPSGTSVATPMPG